MKAQLDGQHELLVLDDGSIKIFRDIPGEKRQTVALSRTAVRRMLAAMTNTLSMFEVGSVLRFVGTGYGSNQRSVTVPGVVPGGQPCEVDLLNKEMFVVDDPADSLKVKMKLREGGYMITMAVDGRDFERV